MNIPYIGVTGFMSRNEVKQALLVVPKNSKHKLAVGVLMSSKTLAGMQNKWPGRYPKRDDVPTIFFSDSRAINIIHYNTDNPETICKQLMEITLRYDQFFDGFQLNVAWPSVDELRFYRDPHFSRCLSSKNKHLILQIGAQAMEQVPDLQEFVERLEKYTSVVDSILVDQSAGKGKSLDPAKGGEILRMVSKHSSLGLGIAGGLNAQTLDVLKSLIRRFPNLSIDAEGRLRTSQPEDALDMEKTHAYLRGAYALLG